MTAKETKQFLKSHFYDAQMITALEAERKQLGPNAEPEQLQRIESEIKILKSKQAKVRAAINQLEDSDLQSILITRYILHKTNEQAATVLHYAPRTVAEKTKRAIYKLCIVLH